MPISLDGGGGAPGLKLKNKGDYAVLRVCHQKQRDALEFGTKKPKLKDDGSPRKELVVTAIFMSGTAVITTGGEDDRRDVTPKQGSEVTLYLGGHKFGSWIEAKRAAGSVNVGDVVRVTYEKDEKSQGGGADKKVWSMKFRVSRVEDEAEEVRKAEGVYRRMVNKGAGSTSVDEVDTGDLHGAYADIPF
jgi:hypothetical protein